MNQLAQKYGPAGLVGAGVGVALAVFDPLKINDPSSTLGSTAPAWLLTLYKCPFRMALIGALIAVVLLEVYTRFIAKKSYGTVSPADAMYYANAYDELLPAEMYGTSSPAEFNNTL